MTNVQATYLGNETITVMLQELIMAPSLKAPAVLASAVELLASGDRGFSSSHSG
jgi:hypothetical protein